MVSGLKVRLAQDSVAKQDQDMANGPRVSIAVPVYNGEHFHTKHPRIDPSSNL